MNKHGAGRGFAYISAEDRPALAAFMREVIKDAGGRATFCERTGIAVDNASKYAGGRSIPSKVNIERMIEAEVIGYSSVDDLVASAPWAASRFRKEAAVKTTKATDRKHQPAAPNQEPAPAVAAPAPAPSLLDVILAEPGLTTQQKVQLSALAALIINGVDVQVSITVAS